MKKQGYNDKLDEKLGVKNGKKKQSLKDRRDESKGMEKASGKKAYSSVKSMDKGSKIKKVLSHIKDDSKEFKKQLSDDKKLKKMLKGKK